MKVLYFIDNYYQNGGACRALRDLIYSNRSNHEYVVYCSKVFSLDKTSSFEIEIGTAESILDFYIEHNYNLIHYFRADGGAVLKDLGRLIKRRHLKIPILTTVCQKPSFKLFQLSPKEIKASDYIVFIDKAAFNDKFYTFIDDKRKKVIYFGMPEETIKYTAELIKVPHNNSCPVIGRASLLTKVPLDTFEVFDNIKNPKEITIIGGGDNIGTFLKLANQHTDYKTTIIEQLPYREYLQELNKFDIFLYYLPLDAHSSIDFTLGEAMLLEKPCVYYGPDAPKERFDDRVNGFVAKSKSELSEICNMLINDMVLQRKIGKNARISTIKNFSYLNTVKEYNALYHQILMDETPNRQDIPLSLYIYFAKTKVVIFLKRVLNKCLRELGIKPIVL